jgi:hypothetical protein
MGYRMCVRCFAKDYGLNGMADLEPATPPFSWMVSNELTHEEEY